MNRFSAVWLSVCVSAVAVVMSSGVCGAAEESVWMAGTARCEITPREPMWLAGYASRRRPAQGTLHPLWIRVLALRDARGHTGIVVSSDTLGIPQSIWQNVCRGVKQEFGLSADQIMLHSSHTHTGPVLRGALYDIYPLDEQQIEKIERYSEWLEDRIVATVGQALSRLQPARVTAGEGKATFAVNRRNNPEAEVVQRRAEGTLQGPTDHTVPVLAVWSADGKLLAAVFTYACHNTCLSLDEWSGDYAGFAQTELENVHPDAVAMFCMGCGGDQNPLPRRTVERAHGYGLRLAAAVERVLAGPMRELDADLRTELEMITLNLGTPPTMERLESLASGSSYRSRWAARLLDDLRAGRPLERTVPYPLQAWRLGRNQLWFCMGGEVVVDYALGFRKRFGDSVWVSAYCNDVMAYIPSLRILDEDRPPRNGYEGNTSMMVYGRGAERWADDVEQRISEGAERLVRRLTADGS